MRYPRWLVFVGAIVMLSLLITAYGGPAAAQDAEPTATESAEEAEAEDATPALDAGEGPTPVPFDIAAEFRINGAASGFEISRSNAQRFNRDYPNVEITVGVAGTAGGFRRFCDASTAFNNAARPILESEAARCEANGIEWIELFIAYEGVVVAAHPEVAEFAACLTTDQLATMWQRLAQPTEGVEPTATPEGYEADPDAATPLPLPTANPGVTNWSQVSASFPDLPLLLFGDLPTTAPADFLSGALTGTQGDIRTDYTANRNYQALVNEMVGKPGALGFFNFGYYNLNEQELTLLAIDGGQGCVEPNAETITSGAYPLARPIYLYVAAEQLDNPAVHAFIDLYLSDEGLEAIEANGYFRAPDPIYEQNREAIAARVTGRAFTEAPPEPEPVATPTPTPEPTDEGAADEATDDTSESDAGSAND